MSGHMAIVAYRSVVGGVPGGSLDVQVRWFAEADAERVRRMLMAEPPHRYANAAGEEVCWELVQVLAVEPFAPSELPLSGDELIGFVTSIDELRRLA